MARMVYDNAFSILDDEEGDDVAALVQQLVKKVVEIKTENENEERQSKSDSGRSEHSRDGVVQCDISILNQVMDDSTSSSRHGSEGGMEEANGVDAIQIEDDGDSWTQVSRPKRHVNNGHSLAGEQKTRNGGNEKKMINGHQRRNARRNGNRDGKFGGKRETPRADNGELKKNDNDKNVVNVGTGGYNSKRRGNGGNRDRGRHQYTRNNREVKQNANRDGIVNQNINTAQGNNVHADADANDVVGVSGSDVAMASDSEVEANGDIEEQKQKVGEKKLTKELEDYKRKMTEEEKKEAALMTLAQYEKLLAEKRKALEAMKSDVRKVAIDKDLESMRRVVKKHDNVEAEESSLKSDKSEEKDSLKKDKGRNAVVVVTADFLRPASYRSGGRGRGRGGRGGFSSSRSGRTAGAVAAQPPNEEDFPVLGANCSANLSVKA